MKRLKQIFLTALVAGATQLASALSYNANDVLLVFRQSGSSDVEFNVGSVNNFLDQPAGTPISVSFNSDYVYTNNGSSFTNVKFDAVAATTSAASQPRVWLTDANLAAMPADFTVSKFSVVRGKIDAVGVQNGAITGSTNMPLVISPTAVGSYSYIVSPGNPTAVGTFGGDVPFTVDATSGNSLAFYQVVASAASPKPSAIKVGTFDFNSTSGAVTFTPVAVSPVFTAPTLSLQGGTQNAGSSKTFSVTADGTCSFQWYLNGTAIGGATSSSLTIASPQLANAGAYTCVASNCTYGTTTTSALAQLNVLDVPSITTQPANAAVARGASATFTVTANNNYAGTGVAPVLGYQWYFNGAVIVNATNASVTIASISHANIGNYSVVVSSAAGSVTSSAATLRFTSATAYLPGDLQLIFRKSGFNNAEINLGSISNYLNLTSGAVVPVAYDTNTVYTNFSSSLASVKFTLAAANSSTLWLSDANLSAVPSDVTLSKFSALRGKVDNAGIQASAITLGANPLLIAGNAVAAWDSIVSPGNSTAVSTLGGDSVFTVEAANSNSVALYQIVASAATPKPAAIKIGTFTYNTDGSVTFTASAVTPVLTSAALSAQAATLNAGVSKTFSVTADGACSFQWYLGGVAIGGATSASYTIASPTSTDAGSYTVVASNCVYGTTTTSSAAQLNVISAPSITTQPAATTVARGGSATLTVVANDGYTGTGGAPTLTYQWYFNGVAIGGATSASLTINPANFAQLGNYSVSVSNPAGTVTSSNAKLSFTSATAYLPGDLQLIFRKTGFNDVEFNLGSVSNYLNLAVNSTVSVPVNTNIVYTNFANSLTSVKFAVAAANSAKLWLSDANLSTIPSDVTLSKFSALRGKVDNAGVQAAAITAGVNSLIIAPTAVSAWDAIVSPGNSGAVGTLGGDSVFAVEAVNSNSVAFYQILPSATTPKPLAQKIGTFAYNTDGTVTFTAASVTPVLLTSTLPAQTIAAGASSSTLAVTASDASNYQWRLNGSAIANATNASFTLTSATTADAGNYSVVVSNATYGTTVTSGNAVITVVGAPTIVTQPTSLTINNGVDATFTITATNDFAGAGSNPTLAYQWLFNGSVITDATNASYTIVNAQFANGGNYSCVASNFAGTATSSNAALVVIDPYISVQPVSTGVVAGATATFSVTAVGTAPMTYQWKFSGTNVTGGTNATLTIPNCSTNFNGRVYSVVVANANGTATSSNATLSVGANVVFVTQPASLTKNQGQVASFTSRATGLAPLTYQWQLNGANIVGANSAGYTNYSVNTNDAGNYTVIAANNIGSVTSAVAVLTVNLDTIAPTVVITAPAAGATLFVGNTNLIGTAADMNGRVSQVQVSLNGGAFTDATLNITNLSPAAASWSYALNFAVGTNTVAVKSVDFAGNVSTTVSRTSFYAVPSALAVNVTGEGFVNSSNQVVSLGGSNLYVGRRYTLTAIPTNTNWLFSNWVNTATSEISSSNIYTFLMSSNLVLNVNFVTNRFIAAAGSYYGLFSETNGAAEHSAGYFTVKTDRKQAFSGTVFVDGDSTAIAGKFDLAGVGYTTKPILRKGKATLVVSLQLNFDDSIGGTVSCAGEDWTAPLSGDRNVFSATNPATNLFAPKYTLLIPGSTNVATEPAGYGYAGLTIKPDGTVATTTASATLADGQAITSLKATVSKHGDWPFYSAQYKVAFNTGSNFITSYNGALIGWLHFETNSTITGTLHWIKTSWTNGYYDAGFNISSDAQGSAYDAPATGARGIFITNGVTTISDGNLSAPFSLNVTISNNNAFAFAANTIGATAKLASALNGIVSGTFTNSTTGLKTTFKGVYLPEQNIIGAQFLGTNQTGGVLIQ